MKLAQGSLGRIRIGCAGKLYAGQQRLAFGESHLNPVPANAQIAIAAKPMRIDATALVGDDHGGALGGQIECRHG